METSFFDILKSLAGYILNLWWLWLPILLAIAFLDTWLYYIRRVYWHVIPWVVLEIKPPRDIERTPKIMEQVFAGFWGIFGTVTTKYEKYVKGFLQDYLSAELVGINGEIHFFMRIPAKYRNLVEAQIWSQYPQSEIKEIEDYVYGVPADVPDKNWNLWGARLKMVKDSIYPLRTYVQHVDIFTRPTSPPFIDPLGGLMEVMSKLQQGEQIWIQILFRPIADDWVEKSKAAVAGLMKKATPQLGEEGGVAMPVLSPGEREVIGLIEQKAAKKAFRVKVQFAYIGRREIFSMANVGATMGLFNQFAALNANSLKPDKTSSTKANYLFAAQRKIFRQKKLMRLLRTRSFWELGYIMNIEELASLFHFPTAAVKAPMTPWLEARRAEPPIGLPTE